MGTPEARFDPETGHLRLLIATDKDTQIPLELLDPAENRDTMLIGRKDIIPVFLAPGYETRQGYRSSDLVPGAIYNRSDNLAIAFDPRNYEEASRKAKELVGNKKSAHYFEELLRALYGNSKIELIHMLVGINQNGNLYHVFGTIYPPRNNGRQRE